MNETINLLDFHQLEVVVNAIRGANRVFLFGVAVRQAVIHVKIILPAVHAFLDGEQAQQKFGAVEVIVGVEALGTALFQGYPQLL